MTLLILSCLAAAAPLYQMSMADADSCLAELFARQANFSARVVELVKQSVGTPYAGDPLGEGPGAKYDADPLMDLRRVDCVTFIEQAIALAASKSYQEAFDLLQKIRYRHGQIGYEHRNHFMVADWIANNAFCRSVTQALEAPTETVTRTISRRRFFEKKNARELGKAIPDQTISLAYVPVSQVAQAEKHLPSPALIVFIGKLDWLFAVHCGLYVRDETGQGLLYHASSTEGKVVTTDFATPFENTSRYLGFTAYAIDDPRAGKIP
jgi:D-alanyl-D-alanine carboxypeptidase/D-alanyl-D-alanine-endopeptidase (penicillin-binding protein 4)